MNKETLTNWFDVGITLCVASACVILLVQLAIVLGIIRFPAPDTIPVCIATVDGYYQILTPNSTEYPNCRKGTDLYIIPAYKTVVK